MQLATSGFQDRCDLAGKPNQESMGHHHLLLDKSLVNMYCSDRAVVSLEGVRSEEMSRLRCLSWMACMSAPAR